jgi:hypothetical protein
MQPKADGKSKKLLYEWQNGEPVAVFEDDRDAAKQYNATSSAALIASGQAKTLQWVRANPYNSYRGQHYTYDAKRWRCASLKGRESPC